MTVSPLGPGSISLGLSLPSGPPAAALAGLRRTALLAVEAGFDGVTLSEHHGGFPGYLPNPVLISGLLLEHLPKGWAIACPTILPLRPAALVAEELAWLAAAHPGRVAAGFVPGYHEQDFLIAGADFAGRRERHWAALATLTAALRGAGPDGVRADPAVAAQAPHALPVVSGVAGPRGARRAAAAGAGLLLMSLAPAADLAPVVRAHREAGGTGPRVLIRRARIGAGEAALDERLERWRGRGAGSWLTVAPEAIASGPATRVVDQLVAELTSSEATALNVRLDVDGAGPVDAQLDAFAEHVLPHLRSMTSGGACL